MRIRSIRPEFWSSEDIAALPWEHRLIYIGLWSYVDDNGVGRDVPKLIVADLFPLDDDTHGALKQVAGALKSFETRQMITRYKVAGKPYLHVTAWDTHQKINRPSGSRYPLPTCEDAETHGALSESSVSPHADSPVGEGEKGRRGEGEKTSSSPAPRPTDAAFDAFWEHYPRKVGKDAGRKAFTKAKRRADVEAIILGAKQYAADPNLPETQYIPHPSKWLNDGRWDDPPLPPRPANGRPAPRRSGHPGDQLSW